MLLAGLILEIFAKYLQNPSDENSECVIDGDIWPVDTQKCDSKSVHGVGGRFYRVHMCIYALFPSNSFL